MTDIAIRAAARPGRRRLVYLCAALAGVAAGLVIGLAARVPARIPADARQGGAQVHQAALAGPGRRADGDVRRGLETAPPASGFR